MLDVRLSSLYWFSAHTCRTPQKEYLEKIKDRGKKTENDSESEDNQGDDI